ncbi:hypothetical protein [Alicyclobacillus acidocaldarius]|uniref:Uncharacterized protein n=1 Tax=Alicyclobacillus acidocaldarius (strain Tc-4-1) TaxID=1048834 RepID=F8IGU5_ALIAT|nr:hypothetical protein [Alicyclobacillus acidocaldarius]AEJ43110.1 hypothetical protein TC41_1165 [Alicyclobacillus acidocaldarius subsp. acidocaldarius Tc-4-1]
MTRHPWLALWPFEWSRSKWVHFPLKTRVAAFAIALVVCTAVSFVICGVQSVPRDRAGLIALCVWGAMGLFVPSRDTTTTGLHVMAHLPYPRPLILCVRIGVAYAQLILWLAAGVVAFVGGAAALGWMHGPMFHQALVLVLALAFADIGFACIASASAAVAGLRLRGFVSKLDTLLLVLVIVMLDDLAAPGPLLSDHVLWYLVAALDTAFGIFCAAVGARNFARGGWLLAGDDPRDVEMQSTQTPRTRVQAPSMAKTEAVRGGTSAVWPLDEWVRTAWTIFRMTYRRGLWGQRAQRRRAQRAAALFVPGLVLVAVVIVGGLSHNPHAFLLTLDAGLIAGAWFWSWICGFAASATVEYLGDWLRGWPVRKEGVIAGIGLAESVSTWLWLGVGVLAGTGVWLHDAALGRAAAADLDRLWLAWGLAMVLGTWYAMWTAAWSLSVGRVGLTAGALPQFAVVGAWAAEGGRVVAWLAAANALKLLGIAFAVAAVAVATVMAQLRYAARRLSL